MAGEKKHKRKDVVIKKIILIESVLLLILIFVFIMINISKKDSSKETESPNLTQIPGIGNNEETTNGADSSISVGDDEKTQNDKVKKEQEEKTKLEQEEEKKKQEEAKALEEINLLREGILNKAASLAAVYDYDAAIEVLNTYEGYSDIPEFIEAVDLYEAKKAECVPFGAYKGTAEISHVFFHSLIVDTSKSFDNDYQANGYNYYMTTIEEFKEMMTQLYDQGYVLVSIHDVAKQVILEDGTVTYQEGDIMLPPDKKPFVLSQDDVNYYDYMDTDGFARRMVLDENGNPTTEMFLDDGSLVIGDFDMVPVLETFLKTHPDFSYKGARGIIALTGYEGALGYRTDPASSDSKTYEEDKETVKAIADAMKELGWEFACHSNGHRDMFKCSDEFLEYDTNQWLKYVGSLVGETDIYIYPFGIEIENTLGPYTNNKYKTLYKAGFRYFCNVDSKPWLQIKKDYVRMGRRPLDGQAMLMYPERLADLFDLSKIIDSSRPTLK